MMGLQQLILVVGLAIVTANPILQHSIGERQVGLTDQLSFRTQNNTEEAVEEVEQTSNPAQDVPSQTEVIPAEENPAPTAGPSIEEEDNQKGQEQDSQNLEIIPEASLADFQDRQVVTTDASTTEDFDGDETQTTALPESVYELIGDTRESQTTFSVEKEPHEVTTQSTEQRTDQIQSEIDLLSEASEVQTETELPISELLPENVEETQDTTEQVEEQTELYTDIPVRVAETTHSEEEEVVTEVSDLVTGAPIQEVVESEPAQAVNFQQLETSELNEQFSGINDKFSLGAFGNQATLEAITTEGPVDEIVTQTDESLRSDETVTESQTEGYEDIAETQNDVTNEYQNDTAAEEIVTQTDETVTETIQTHKLTKNSETQSDLSIKTVSVTTESQTESDIEASQSQTEDYVDIDETQNYVTTVPPAEANTDETFENEANSRVSGDVPSLLMAEPETTESQIDAVTEAVEFQTNPDATDEQRKAEIEPVTEVQTETPSIEETTESQTAGVPVAVETQTNTEIEAVETFTEAESIAAEVQTIQDEINAANNEETTEGFHIFPESTTTKESDGSIVVSVNNGGFTQITEVVTAEDEDNDYWKTMNKANTGESEDQVEKEFQKVAEKYGLKSPVIPVRPVAQANSQASESSQLSENPESTVEQDFVRNPKPSPLENETFELNELRRKRGFVGSVARYMSSFF